MLQVVNNGKIKFTFFWPPSQTSCKHVFALQFPALYNLPGILETSKMLFPLLIQLILSIIFFHLFPNLRDIEAINMLITTVDN